MKKSFLLLPLIMAPAPALAQARVDIEFKNETSLPIKAVGNRVEGRWSRFETSASPTGLSFTAQGSSSWVGVSGSLTLHSESGEPVGTLSFDFPWVGEDTIRLVCTPPYYGFIDYQEPFSREHKITVLLQRQRQATRTLNLPSSGPGVVRGRVSWDEARVQGKNGLTMAEAVKRHLTLRVKAPSLFYELDPAFAPNQSYQGRPGGYDTLVPVGQFRWLASDATGIAFEVTQLPLEVPLLIKAVSLADPRTLFQAGPQESAPNPRLMFPPAKSAPTFSVRVEAQSAFRGPLEPSNPLYPAYPLSLEPLWLAESGDSSGVSAVDPATARLRMSARSQINPSPLKERTTLTGPRLSTSPASRATIGPIKRKR